MGALTKQENNIILYLHAENEESLNSLDLFSLIKHSWFILIHYFFSLRLDYFAACDAGASLLQKSGCSWLLMQPAFSPLLLWPQTWTVSPMSRRWNSATEKNLQSYCFIDWITIYPYLDKSETQIALLFPIYIELDIFIRFYYHKKLQSIRNESFYY